MSLLYITRLVLQADPVVLSVAEIRKERNLSTLETFVINVISPDVVIDTDTVGKEAMLKAKMGSTHIRRRLRERAEQEKAAQKASSTE